MSEPIVDGVNEQNLIVGDDSKKKDTAFEAVKAEKKAALEENAKLKAELGKIQDEKRVKEDDALKQKGEYKLLWEKSEAEKKEIAEQLLEKDKRELQLRKIDVVMKEIGSPLIKPEYWNLVNIERIPYDEATKDIDYNIAKEVATDFLKNYPELIKGKATKLPSNAAHGGGVISYETWAKMPLSEQRKNYEQMTKVIKIK